MGMATRLKRSRPDQVGRAPAVDQGAGASAAAVALGRGKWLDTRGIVVSPWQAERLGCARRLSRLPQVADKVEGFRAGGGERKAAKGQGMCSVALAQVCDSQTFRRWPQGSGQSGQAAACVPGGASSQCGTESSG